MQVKAYGPGLEKSGCIVNNPAEFFIDPKEAGTAPLSIYAQVGDIDIYLSYNQIQWANRNTLFCYYLYLPLVSVGNFSWLSCQTVTEVTIFEW